MARKKISEYRAKTILYKALGVPYTGLSLDLTARWQTQVEKLSSDAAYVVKVDEGIKGRFKKGLVKLKQTPSQIPEVLQSFSQQGYRYVLIEPYSSHEQTEERYIAIERQRVGNIVTFSTQGGIHIEDHEESLTREKLQPSSADSITRLLGLSSQQLQAISTAFDVNHFSFLEVNPFIIAAETIELLDAAVEVDEAAASLVEERWSPADFRDGRATTSQEQAVETLAARSQASFRLKVLNPNGRIFLLLSGGGASIAQADEVATHGFGNEIGNYGEYSGNPSAEEAYLYTKEVVSLMIESQAKKSKILIISGGVANFTDIRVTFQGVIRAMEDVVDQLTSQNIKVYVRRGGPHEEEGLAMMRSFLKSNNLLGLVAGPELALSEVAPRATQGLKS